MAVKHNIQQFSSKPAGKRQRLLFLCCHFLPNEEKQGASSKLAAQRKNARMLVKTCSQANRYWNVRQDLLSCKKMNVCQSPPVKRQKRPGGETQRSATGKSGAGKSGAQHHEIPPKIENGQLRRGFQDSASAASAAKQNCVTNHPQKAGQAAHAAKKTS